MDLICYMPEAVDATSFYRAMGPLQTLRKARPKLNLIVGPTASWATMKMADAVFLQRPCADNHVAIMKLAQSNRRPTWVDYDDDLFSVPASNRAAKLYNNPHTQNNMTEILCRADVVTVSTGALADRVRGVLEAVAAGPKPGDDRLTLDPAKVIVIPNAYDEGLLSRLDRTPQTPNGIVSWRGSGTHDKDLWGVTPGLCDLVRKRDAWTFAFVGDPFWLTLERMREVNPKQISHVESIDPIEYFRFIKGIRPAIMMVPLDDSPFNRAKSNIAWLEAVHAGAVTVAPDWPEWQRPGVFNYRPDDFAGSLDRLMDLADGYRTRLWKQSADFVAKELTLSAVNRKREFVLEVLMRRRAIYDLA